MVPVIQEPIIKTMPIRAEYTDNGFVSVDEDNFIISKDDLKVFTKYVVDLKTYGSAGWIWVDYYIDELNEFNESIDHKTH